MTSITKNCPKTHSRVYSVYFLERSYPKTLFEKYCSPLNVIDMIACNRNFISDVLIAQTGEKKNNMNFWLLKEKNLGY